MKLFFISDIHGSSYYLSKFLERYREEEGDYLIILGDILYHGARNDLPRGYNPKEVIALLNKYSHEIIAVRGNCDSEVDEMVLEFPIRADYSNILYGDRRIFLTHGHIYNEDEMPSLKEGDIFFYGHSHLPRAEKKDGIYFLNPGSISLAKGGNPNSYGVLEDELFTIRDLDGNRFKEILVD